MKLSTKIEIYIYRSALCVDVDPSFNLQHHLWYFVKGFMVAKDLIKHYKNNYAWCYLCPIYTILSDTTIMMASLGFYGQTLFKATIHAWVWTLLMVAFIKVFKYLSNTWYIYAFAFIEFFGVSGHHKTLQKPYPR